MANAIYGKAREAWAGGTINWSADTIACVLVDLADYTVSINTHQFLSDVPSAARVATFSGLTSKTRTLGVLDAADFSFTAVTGDQSEALIFYKDTGSAATSPLLVFVDTATSGLPVTPNGGDIGVVLNAAGIATL